MSCYGPQLAFVNHPNYSAGQGQDNSTLPTGDLGIWTAYNDNTTQEACSVGQMNLLMDKAGRKVDLAMGITAMMICAAKNDGLSKPKVDGAALDVTASVAKTKIKDKVFIGSNSSLVAPVTLNENSIVGAGSVITKNVKKKSLALTRSVQTEVMNYKKQKK